LKKEEGLLYAEGGRGRVGVYLRKHVGGLLKKGVSLDKEGTTLIAGGEKEIDCQKQEHLTFSFTAIERGKGTSCDLGQGHQRSDRPQGILHIKENGTGEASSSFTERSKEGKKTYNRNKNLVKIHPLGVLQATGDKGTCLSRFGSGGEGHHQRGTGRHTSSLKACRKVFLRI